MALVMATWRRVCKYGKAWAIKDSGNSFIEYLDEY